MALNTCASRKSTSPQGELSNVLHFSTQNNYIVHLNPWALKALQMQQDGSGQGRFQRITAPHNCANKQICLVATPTKLTWAGVNVMEH